MRQLTIETTANPKVIKFATDYTLIPGSLELDRTTDNSEIPLAGELLKFPFVEKIFITANFIAVAKADSVEWSMVQEQLKEVIEDQLLENPRLYARTKKRELFPVYAEMTPNPAVMKFVSQRFIVEGFLEVKSKEASVDVPLAFELYNEFDFVTEVFISDNFVAVTKNDSVEWHQVMVAVRGFIAEFLQAGNTVSLIKAQSHEAPAMERIQREYSTVEQQISDILDEYVAPAVENDGGKITLIEYDAESKTAKMLLQGACSGCPSSTATLKGGIENILKQFVPDLVESVEAVNG